MKHLLIDEVVMSKVQMLRTILISIIVAVLMLGVIYYITRDRLEQLNKEWNIQMNQSLYSMENHLEDKIHSMYLDLGTLSKTVEVINYINDDQNKDYQEALLSLFYTYSENKNALTQIRLLDETGQEKIRLNKTDEGIAVVADNALQDKSNRYYFTNAMEMGNEDLYISDFDLNIEKGVIVLPYEPTIRFAVKLYDRQGREKGIIIVNVDGLDYLKVVESYGMKQDAYKNYGLIDSNNYWSLNHENENDYSEISLTVKEGYRDEINQMVSLINLESRDTIFNFSNQDQKYAIYPVMPHNNGHYIFENAQTSWFLLGYYDQTNLKLLYYSSVEYLIPISLLVILLSAIIAYLIQLYLKIKERHQIALLTSAYISDNSHVGIMIANASKKIVYVNNIFEKIFGYRFSDVSGLEMNTIFKGNLSFFKKEIGEAILWNGNVWNETAGHQLICKHLTVKVLRDSKDKVIYYIGIYSNPELDDSLVSPFKPIHSNIFYLDEESFEKIAQQVSLNQDVKGFFIFSLQLLGSGKKILENNQNIHSQFVQNFQNALKEEGLMSTVAIPRTDLMVLMTHEYPHLENYQNQQEMCVEDLIALLKKHFIKMRHTMGLNQFDLSFQVGVAYHTTEPIMESIIQSVIALEALIKLKKSSYLIYDDSYQDLLKQEKNLRKHLEKAFYRDEFFVVFQPQFSLNSNEIMGFEALVRWKNEELGLISPDVFIPILEESEQIHQLAIRVLEIIDDLMDKHFMIDCQLRLSVNISGIEFSNNETLDRIILTAKRVMERGIKMCFEITETTLIKDFQVVNEAIKKCNREHIEVSIDDFGTGYSSLGYLKKLQAQELKIDKVFIEDYPHKDDGKIIKAVISMGKELGLKIVVEGIEEAEQLDFVRNLKCDFYQGYYGAKPMSMETLIDRFNLK